jgi:hypothetical protein
MAPLATAIGWELTLRGLSWESYRRRAGALLSFPEIVVNHLAFFQIGEGDAFDLRMVEEQVISSGLDKPKAAIRN